MTNLQGSGVEAHHSNREFVGFRMAGNDFAIDIQAVREIRSWSQATPLAGAPDHILGVVNLRGAALPILDLAVRLGFPPTEVTTRHAIIVVQIGEALTGLLVEGVSEILTVDRSVIQPAPAVGGGWHGASMVAGLVAKDDRMISVLALDHILSDMVALAA